MSKSLESCVQKSCVLCPKVLCLVSKSLVSCVQKSCVLCPKVFVSCVQKSCVLRPKVLCLNHYPERNKLGRHTNKQAACYIA
jgi:hypothetical protein